MDGLACQLTAPSAFLLPTCASGQRWGIQRSIRPFLTPWAVLRISPPPSAISFIVGATPSTGTRYYSASFQPLTLHHSMCVSSSPLLPVYYNLLSWGSTRSSNARTSTTAMVSSSAPSPSRWKVLSIPGDGRCMFRSLVQGSNVQHKGSLLSSADELAAADQLRQDVCDQLLKQRDDIAPFIDGDYESYVADMRQPRTWGGEPELAAAAVCLQSQIDVYQPDGIDVAKTSSYGEGPAGKQPIPLLFYRLGHYDLLLDPNTLTAPRL